MIIKSLCFFVFGCVCLPYYYSFLFICKKRACVPEMSERQQKVQENWQSRWVLCQSQPVQKAAGARNRGWRREKRRLITKNDRDLAKFRHSRLGGEAVGEAPRAS